MKAANPRSWGIDESYWDIAGNHRTAPGATIEAILHAMGAGDEEPDNGHVWIVHPGEEHALGSPVEIETEDGGSVWASDRLPPDLPLGYHTLRPENSDPCDLIVSPGRCFLPDETAIWGWAAQLYALRSERSWGIGDLSDLRRLMQWGAGGGAGMTLISPLHSVDPSPERSSPYYAGSRVWHNPLYLAVEEVPGAAAANADIERLAAAGRKLNSDRRIDRAEVFRLKDPALRRLHERFGGSSAYDAFCREWGETLTAFATFCALAEIHGPDWRTWPVELRDPSSPAVASARRTLRSEVDYHRWLQWLIDEQLQRAGAEGAIVQDLAIGVNPRGPDAWMWQGTLAGDVTVGAPPDDFNLDGQNWGVLTFDPWRLRAASYEPFIRTLRAVLRHSGGVRYDHVMGLWRLFWIPRGSDPSAGTYVRYPASDLLDIVALESHRARAFVVGEDLGTVEPGVREEMAERAMLSYKLMWFEQEHPAAWPRCALGAVTNHDLPTIAGVWSGADLVDQTIAGVQPNRAFDDAARARISWLAATPPDAPALDASLGLHRALARAPCRVLAATLEDALGVEERPNLPGTSDDQRANWCFALPLPLEAIEHHPGPAAVAEILSSR